MQTTLYLIRHGEVNNPNNIIYGRLPNFGLTEKGKLQITRTAEFLKDKQITEIYSSPLERAIKTAEIIQEKLGLNDIHIADEITEVKTSYQRRKFSELDTLQSEVYLKPLDPTDETIEQIAKRMVSFIKKIISKHPGKHIIVVSHGDPIMVLKTVIKQRPLTFKNFKIRPYIQPGEVYRISADENTLSVMSVFKPQV